MYVEKKLTVSHDDTTKKEGDLGLNLTEEIPSVGGCSSWNSFGPSAILQNVRAFLINHNALWYQVLFDTRPPVVQKADKVDNAIHRINHYPVGSVVWFVSTYPLDSDLSGG